MPITTWIYKEEQAQMIKVWDKDVNELLQEVREIKPSIHLSETEINIPRLFRKNKTTTAYTIYHIFGEIDAQVINLYGLGGPYPKEVVMAFLIGCLTNKEK